MTVELSIKHVQQACEGWTKRLTEGFLVQLSSQQMFMDIDVIPGVWSSRSISRRQQWEAEPLSENSSVSKDT